MEGIGCAHNNKVLYCVYSRYYVDRVAYLSIADAIVAVAAVVVADLTVHRKVNPERLDLHDVIGHDDVDPARHFVSWQVHVFTLVVEHHPEQF